MDENMGPDAFYNEKKKRTTLRPFLDLFYSLSFLSIVLTVIVI